MRKYLLLGLLFALFNFGVFWCHILLFQSPWPFSSWISILIQIIILIIFPYKKVFKHEIKDTKNAR
jgi:putative flippase GtrA